MTINQKIASSIPFIELEIKNNELTGHFQLKGPPWHGIKVYKESPKQFLYECFHSLDKDEKTKPICTMNISPINSSYTIIDCFRDILLETVEEEKELAHHYSEKDDEFLFVNKCNFGNINEKMTVYFDFHLISKRIHPLPQMYIKFSNPVNVFTDMIPGVNHITNKNFGIYEKIDYDKASVSIFTHNNYDRQERCIFKREYTSDLRHIMFKYDIFDAFYMLLCSIKNDDETADDNIFEDRQDEDILDLPWEL